MSNQEQDAIGQTPFRGWKLIMFDHKYNFESNISVINAREYFKNIVQRYSLKQQVCCLRSAVLILGLNINVFFNVYPEHLGKCIHKKLQLPVTVFSQVVCLD